MLYRIYQQTNVDMFFIDWEHDKNIIVKNAEEKTPQKYKGAWRILFIANQFNSLQTKRKINLEFCFAILCMLWYHFDWQKHANNNATLNKTRNSPDIYLLSHFLASFILVVIGICFILFRYIIDIVKPSRKIIFMDLLSISNISLFLLDTSLHGFYIHGQSPAGKADATMEELISFLDDESKGQSKTRSLDGDDKSHQSYEIFISYSLRQSYDALFALKAESRLAASKSDAQLGNQSKMTDIFKVLPKTFPFEYIAKLMKFTNSELKEKFQKVSNQASRYVKTKTMMQRFLSLPPYSLVQETAEDMILYKDRNDTFDTILLFGIDWEWYLLNIYIFEMWMLTLNSFAISIMLTLVCDKIMIGLRSWYGERNIAKKSIIDTKFFV